MHERRLPDSVTVIIASTSVSKGFPRCKLAGDETSLGRVTAIVLFFSADPRGGSDARESSDSFSVKRAFGASTRNPEIPCSAGAVDMMENKAVVRRIGSDTG